MRTRRTGFTSRKNNCYASANTKMRGVSVNGCGISQGLPSRAREQAVMFPKTVKHPRSVVERHHLEV
jgi:hypothetical protein